MSSEEGVKAQVQVTMKVAAPGMKPWLKITGRQSGDTFFLPLPIRMIRQIPDTKGGGCIVRGAYGDEAEAKESISEILDALSGYPVGGAATSWAIAE